MYFGSPPAEKGEEAQILPIVFFDLLRLLPCFPGGSELLRRSRRSRRSALFLIGKSEHLRSHSPLLKQGNFAPRALNPVAKNPSQLFHPAISAAIPKGH